MTAQEEALAKAGAQEEVVEKEAIMVVVEAVVVEAPRRRPSAEGWVLFHSQALLQPRRPEGSWTRPAAPRSPPPERALPGAHHARRPH